MATKPVTRGVQDMPPPGGFPKINTTRGIRPRGPSGFAIWAGIIGASVFGMYQIGLVNAENRANRKETREARMALFPYFKAEQDMITNHRTVKRLELEDQIMNNRQWVVRDEVQVVEPKKSWF